MEELVKHLRNFMNDIDPLLIDSISQVLRGASGKRGAVHLQGPPSTGKSIIVRLFCAPWQRHEIGVIVRSADNNTFWMQDLVGKKCYVGEEICLSDTGADAFKLVLEGHFLACTDVKNKNKVGLQKRPTILTSNFNICYMCPRQTESVNARLLQFTTSKIITRDNPINQIHLLDNEQLYLLHKMLFC